MSFHSICLQSLTTYFARQAAPAVITFSVASTAHRLFGWIISRVDRSIFIFTTVLIRHPKNFGQRDNRIAYLVYLDCQTIYSHNHEKKHNSRNSKLSSVRMGDMDLLILQVSLLKSCEKAKCLISSCRDETC